MVSFPSEDGYEAGDVIYTHVMPRQDNWKIESAFYFLYVLYTDSTKEL